MREIPKMNIGLIEKAVESAISTAIPSLHVVKLSDEGVIPNESSYAIVACEKCDNLVAQLWKAVVSITIHSPAPSVSLDDHNANATLVVDAVGLPSLYTNYNAVSVDHTCAGGKILSSEGGIEENSYRHTISILLGILQS